MKHYDVCLCMGRFQPFHWGHFDLIQATLASGNKAIALLGSHQDPPSLKNPWSSKEREEMIRMCLHPSDQERIWFIPICDYATNDEWATAIHKTVRTIAMEQDTIALASYHHNGQSFFSQWFPGWDYVERLRHPHLNATDIRLAYFGGYPETAYLDQLPSGTLRYLRAFKTKPVYQQLCQQMQQSI